MNKHVNNIANRLSLRVPQREALEILAQVAEIVPLSKERNPGKTLEAIASKYPSVKNFERYFPSLCFALATGVGKTRLMGAFISYLHISKGIKHFFVLAPNLTIYNKLIADFTPGTPKYVFHGISQFAMAPPEIITGDNYESGRGIRNVDMFGQAEGIHINVFNVSKIDSEVKDGAAPRIRRLSEYIGESYFDYLAALEDLVLLMDESHRYRGSAGVKAINELNPVLGLELTATPQVEAGRRSTPFRNVIYSYPLRKAMEDGYVKEPAVATRANFKAKNYEGKEDQLERLKLEDGIRIHETVKTDLRVYADNHDEPYVKPFMLVVAQDTDHADEIMELIQSDEFFEGRYKDRVITVHSAKKGEEKEKTVESLLSVEKPEEPTEIVIHVNMLKEGWDVTNLYTIVPLRAANSRTLVEQSIGRGLRLPYGKRTGVASVDRLTIVAHDRFDEIISEANDERSIIRASIVIGENQDYEPKKSVAIPSKLESIITAQPFAPELIAPSQAPGTEEQAPLLQEEDREAAIAVLEEIESLEGLPNSESLREEAAQQEIANRVEGRIKPDQRRNVGELVRKITQVYIETTIYIPRIVLIPQSSRTPAFTKFALDKSRIGRFDPVDQEILIRYLRTAEREQMQGDLVAFGGERLEDPIVSALSVFNDISYGDHADILYDLAGQMVEYLQSYLSDEKDVLNVLQYYANDLAKAIHEQMGDHYERGHTEYKATVIPGFERPKMMSVSYGAQEKARYFRNRVEERSMIRGMLFQGFKKCIYPAQKFHSDPERQFAVLLEREKKVLKWFKPGRRDLKIRYAADRTYEPDFVVETNTCKLLCEPKMEREIGTDEVEEKARAARKWCETASEHDVKPWKYLLIPHNAIRKSANLSGLISRFGGQGE